MAASEDVLMPIYTFSLKKLILSSRYLMRPFVYLCAIHTVPDLHRSAIKDQDYFISNMSDQF